MEHTGLYLTWSQLLWLTLVIVLFYIAEWVLMLNWHRRQLQKHTNIDYENKISHLENALADLKAFVMAQKADNTHLAESDSYEVPDSESIHTETAYSLAIELAKKGADAATLVRECGLSRAEADLIVAIYHGVYKG